MSNCDVANWTIGFLGFAMGVVVGWVTLGWGLKHPHVGCLAGEFTAEEFTRDQKPSEQKADRHQRITIENLEDLGVGCSITFSAGQVADLVKDADERNRQPQINQ